MPFLTGPVTDERDAHVTFLTQQLDQLRICALGLDDDQLRTAPIASSLSLAGLFAHVAQTVAQYLQGVYENGVDQSSLNLSPESFTLELNAFYSGAEIPEGWTGDQIRLCLQQATDLVQPVLGAADFEARVPIPEAPWFPQDLESWNIRWIAHHLSTEVARHVGHADVIREAIDGEIAYSLNARDEGQEFKWADYEL
ncbi:DUF664 domain-containing protein [Citricoccus sp. GCM10030269]|uniref:mycothiol transferase n=1 Tax=Citricoccus sp. GCM10030269 TaxID=3273388 RepID=UPI00361C6788